nr:lipid II flippase MurJ [Arsenicicoccus dermatophilus]
MVFSHEVGAGCVGSAYATANTVPNVLYEVAAGGALAAVAVPLVAGHLARGDDASADQVVSALLTWALVVLVPAGVVLALLADPVAGALTGSVGCAGQRELVARMLWWFAPQIPLYGIGVVAAGALQARRRFTGPALAPLLSSLVVIAAYLTYGALTRPAEPSPASGALVALAGGTTLGVVALSLPLLVPLVRDGVRLRPTLQLPAGEAARARALAGAGLVALLAQQAAVLGTVWLAQLRGGVGALNAYQYLQAVYVLPHAVLAVPVATAIFPALSGASRAPGNVDEPDAAVAARLAGALRVIVVAGSLGAAVLVGAGPAVGRFFAAVDASRHQARADRAIDLAAVVGPGLTAFAPGLVGFGLLALLTRATYVRGRAWTAAGWSAAGWALALVVPLLATRTGAGATQVLVALGVGSSVGMTVAALGLLAAVRAAWGEAGVRGVGRGLVAAVPVVALGGLAGRALGSALPAPTGAWTAVAIGIACAAAASAVWATMVWLLDREAARSLVRRVSRARG